MTALMNARWWEAQSQDFVNDYGVLLVMFTHPQLAEPIRVNASDVDVMHDGKLWSGWPLSPRLPSQGDAQQRGGLRVADVDTRMGRVILGLKGDVEVAFLIVEREDTESVIYDHYGLKLSNVRKEGFWIVADVTGQGAHGLAYPRSTATPDFAPGIFVA